MAIGRKKRDLRCTRKICEMDDGNRMENARIYCMIKKEIGRKIKGSAGKRA